MAAESHRAMEVPASDLTPDATLEPTGALCERAPSAPAQEAGQTNLRPYLSAIRVYAASLSLVLQLSPNSNRVGSFTLKRPDRRRAEAALWRAAKAEGRAPTNRQLLDAPERKPN